MAKWECRSCGGGFPKPHVRSQRPVCPWCGEPIGKQFAASETQRRNLLREYGLGSYSDSKDGEDDA